MLPFTKRPGRSEDGEVVTKDDLPASGIASAKLAGANSGVPASTMRSVPASRPPVSSESSEDELTSVHPHSRSFAGSVVPSSRRNNALGETGPVSRSMTGPPPLSMTGPRIPSVRPPPMAARPHEDEDAEDDEEGRTVVRDAPKVVKRTHSKGPSVPPSLSPAAVIKATLESSPPPRSRRDLLPGPPAALLEDRSDFEHVSRHEVSLYTPQSTQPFEGPPSRAPHSGPHSAPHSVAPMMANTESLAYRQEKVTATAPASYRNEALAHAQTVAQAPQSGPAPQVIVQPSQSPSMPAHFMTPQAPYPQDPPGTAVTAGYHVTGRPAVSWAAALLACGLFVGVAAVAVLQTSDAAADTTASFVDPSRAPMKTTAVQPQQVAQPQPQQVALPPMQAAAPPPQAPVPQAPVLQAPPAAPMTPAAPAPVPGVIGASAAAQPGPGVGGFGSVVGGFAPVAVPQTAAPAPATPAKAVVRAPPFRAAPPPPKREPPPPKAPALASSSDDDGAKATPAKKKKGEDDETKKALEALQKAQLESASSFGKE
jgi:hypothetical protein